MDETKTTPQITKKQRPRSEGCRMRETIESESAATET